VEPVRSKRRGSHDPALKASVVVVAYNIERELPRTLRSLDAEYQRGVDAADYEVIVVDNGSSTPVDDSVFDGLAGQFRLIRIEDASPSPAQALNRGLSEARGELVGVMIDGARMVSPGFVHFAIEGSRTRGRSGVASLGWYLGYDFQRYALDAGWTRDDEDRLLESIDWPADGYRLFEIATMDESSTAGWFYGPFESNGLFLPAEVWSELGGFDERFDEPGGGFLNLDILNRASVVKDLGWVILLGEGTFHQLHGGVATNASAATQEQSLKGWTAHYERVTGHPLVRAHLPDPVFIGMVPDAMRPSYALALNSRLRNEGGIDETVCPEVSLPDPGAATDRMAAEWMGLAAGAAGRGLTVESVLYARLAREAEPTSSQLDALLACIANMGSLDGLSPERRTRFHLDAGDACERVGALDAATDHYLEALVDDPESSLAYRGLTRVRMPGPAYHEILARTHDLLDPATYLEIGVCEGDSLVLARPPTVAVAVDPDPQIHQPISVECHLFRETSTEFFKGRDVRKLFGGRGPSLVFIDGLHEFPAALEDFWQVEAISDPGTIIVLHDMITFDEVSQRPERAHDFYTGDVWKMLHVLADVRPDLSWFTVPTAPSGLTFVSGLDATSTVLRDRYTELVQRYGSLPFEASLEIPGDVVENDWRVVSERLLEVRAANRRSETEVAESDDASPTPVTAASRDTLSRRVRELEERDVARRAECADLRRAAEQAEAKLLEWHQEEDNAAAQLEALRGTRLYRYSRAVRKVYARLRHREVA
jgi:hypothetical protein